MRLIKFLPVIFLFLFSCHPTTKSESPRTVSVVLPSMTQNMDPGEILTYSALIILNDTSAHLFILKPDLTIEGELAENYQTNADKTKYRIFLKKNYLSARKEPLSSEDVVFSTNYLASHSAFVKTSLQSVVGIEHCTEVHCNLDVKSIYGNSVEFQLKNPDPYFISKISTPFFIILKKSKPYMEQIGNCKIPYQTGQSLLAECNRDFQRVVSPEGIVNLYKQKLPSRAEKQNLGRILTSNPGLAPSPSLIVLSMYAIPQSDLSKPLQLAVLQRLMLHRQELAQKTKLKASYTVVSEWFKLNQRLFPGINVFEKPPSVFCPNRPIVIAMETTLPDLDVLREWLLSSIPCDIDLVISNTDEYFKQFYKADFGFLWVTPDYLDYYNIYSVFDCIASNCYFNWHDKKMESLFNRLRDYKISEGTREELAIEMEKYLMSHGYVAPLLQMNAWIEVNNITRAVHPAGLAQLKSSDFLKNSQ